MNGPAFSFEMTELVDRRLLVKESAEQYAFRHALMRDAVYGTLLRSERRELHQAVGEAIENLYVDRLDAHLGDLAFHFFEAEEWDTALDYAVRAGERAQATYASREAVQYFTRALQAARRLPGRRDVARLFRARGQAYDTLGEFDQARADHESALHAAQANKDRAAEWQSLFDLGFLWASRDYTKSGELLRQALDLARSLGNPALLGQSLNRVGNWYMNLEQMDEARRHHDEALQVFQKLNHVHGQAETLDLLGMLSCLSGDLLAGHDYYVQAVEHFERLQDRWGLAYSLASMALAGLSFESSIVISAPLAAEEMVGPPQRSLAIAHEIGWRSAEAYAHFILASSYSGLGDYGQALLHAREALAVSEEIEHRQWTAAAVFSLGAIHLDLIAPTEARLHFAESVSLADEIGSLFWKSLGSGFLALTCVAQGDLDFVGPMLDTYLGPSAPRQTMVQRVGWQARAELALARNDPAQALAIADELLDSGAHVAEQGQRALPRLLVLRSRALLALGRPIEAEPLLRAACDGAQAFEQRPALWRAHAALGGLLLAQGRPAEAQAEMDAARALAAEMAAGVQPAALRDQFLAQIETLCGAFGGSFAWAGPEWARFW